MRRIVVDANAVDKIIDQPGVFEQIEAAVSAGTVQLLYTHVTIDELAETPDLDRRQHLCSALEALGEQVPTGAFVFGFSRLGLARLSNDVEAFEAFRLGNMKHTRDALIAATAMFEECAVLTNDKGAINRARARGLEVLKSEDLMAELTSATDDK